MVDLGTTDGPFTIEELRGMGQDRDRLRRHKRALEEHVAALNEGLKSAPRPYREGLLYKYGNSPVTQHLVECTLYPKAQWWIYDYPSITSTEPIKSSRRELTPEEWDELSPLKL